MSAEDSDSLLQRLRALRWDTSCRFCGALRDRHLIDGDDAARWIHCTGCGAHGPTVSVVGSLNRGDQIRRARDKFYAVDADRLKADVLRAIIARGGELYINDLWRELHEAADALAPTTEERT